ncbi:unnamed protein product [Acanthosepion pharaonis]|uniref:Uncharacterized protein n=1 Tax=Acanthosepion pharaonis TaxID=158019 RepID=A0A812DKX3_ACAPH|nr:unnamed protein product [Sepia pharaonis]
MFFFLLPVHMSFFIHLIHLTHFCFFSSSFFHLFSSFSSLLHNTIFYIIISLYSGSFSLFVILFSFTSSSFSFLFYSISFHSAPSFYTSFNFAAIINSSTAAVSFNCSPLRILAKFGHHYHSIFSSFVYLFLLIHLLQIHSFYHSMDYSFTFSRPVTYLQFLLFFSFIQAFIHKTSLPILSLFHSHCSSSHSIFNDAIDNNKINRINATTASFILLTRFSRGRLT